MIISNSFKIAVFVGSFLIMPTALAMDVDLVEVVIESLLESQLDDQAIATLSANLKELSAERAEKATEFLLQVYIKLVSENKLEIAQHLLASLAEQPQLKNIVENLQDDLAKKIAAGRMPAPQPSHEKRTTDRGATELLQKEPFRLEDANQICTIIKTAVMNDWQLDIPALTRALIAKTLRAFAMGSLDEKVIPSLTEIIKMEALNPALKTDALINQIFTEIIPGFPLANEQEKNKTKDFTWLFINDLLSQKVINNTEFQHYLTAATRQLVVPRRRIPPQQAPTLQRPPIPKKPSTLQRPPMPPLISKEDSELAPIINEHALSKKELEGNRIESTEEVDFLVPLSCPTEFTIKNGTITVRVQQMPTLSQLEYRGKDPAEVIKELAIAKKLFC